MVSKWTDAAPADPDADPYADWERATRPDFLKETFRLLLPGSGIGLLPIPIEFPHWQPLYVRILGETPAEILANVGVIEAAAQAKFGSDGPMLRLGRDARLAIDAILALGGQIKDHERLCFLYLPEGLPANDAALAKLFKIVLRGPAVPGLTLLDSLAREQALNAEGDGRTKPGKAARTPVVTAVIDTELGIANERFCYLDRGTRRTRVRHFWRQQQETLGATPAFALGHEFDAKHIDAMLQASGGDEGAFYALLRQAERAAEGQRLPLARASGPHLSPEQRLLQRLIRHFGLPAGTDESVRNLDNPGDWRIQSVPSYVGKGEARAWGHRAGHGTWVADIAAGEPMTMGRADRPIVMVELPDYAVADTQGARLAVFVLMAVRRILTWVDHWPREAKKGGGKSGSTKTESGKTESGKTGSGKTGRVPVVINISLSNSAGPRDGTSGLEAEIARLVDARNAAGVATKVVMAAGNTFRDRLAAGFDLAAGARETLDWNVPPANASPSFLETRMVGAAPVAVTITPPDGAGLTLPVPQKGDMNQTWTLTRAGLTVGRIYRQTARGKSVVTLALTATAPRDPPFTAALAGTYRIGFLHTGASGTDPVRLRADVQRDETLSGWPQAGVQSHLDHPLAHERDPETGALDLPGPGSPISRRGTISAFATSAAILAVGGALAQANAAPTIPRPARYAGSGPVETVTPDGVPVGKPDLSAVTEEGPATPGLRAAGYFSGASVAFSGTSGAAPQVTRDWVNRLNGNPSQTTIPVPPGDPLRLGAAVQQPVLSRGRVARRRSIAG